MTLGFIEELNNRRRVMEEEYSVTEQECDEIGEMCDPYEGLCHNPRIY